jgi:hypothetical protein
LLHKRFYFKNKKFQNLNFFFNFLIQF